MTDLSNVFNTPGFWNWVKEVFQGLSSAWTWLNTPFFQMLDFMPQWAQDLLTNFTPNGFITPLFMISVVGISIVIVFRFIHLINFFA